MPISPAEKMRAYRERQKANNQKPVSFLIDADIAETVTSYAKQHQTTQADVFNNLLRQALAGNKLPSYQKEIDRLNAEIEQLKQSAKPYHQTFVDKKLIAQLQKENSELKAQLTAKPALLQPEPIETEINLTPAAVYEWIVYGEKRLLAVLPDDYRLFVKFSGKRWTEHDGKAIHISENNGRFYFGKTEIKPVKYAGKLPKTLIMR